MRIDLPTCSFKLCRRYSDGNCTGSKGDRDECEEFKRSEQEPKQALDNGYGVYFCPTCKGSLWQIPSESNFCFRCGQRIKRLRR
jgi:hypothetical protein